MQFNIFEKHCKVKTKILTDCFRDNKKATILEVKHKNHAGEHLISKSFYAQQQ